MRVRIWATLLLTVAAMLGTPAPASAALANRSAYALADQPTASSYVIGNTNQYNSLAGANHVDRVGVGSYTVTFDRVGTSGGIAHAQSYGTNANFCNVLRWYQSGNAEKVEVLCFTGLAAPVDTYFLVNFASGTTSSAVKMSYLLADQPTATTTYPPTSQWDSMGGTGTVTRVWAGRYRVVLPASSGLYNQPFHLQVTTYGQTPMHCKVSATFILSSTQQVDCFKRNGQFADAAFTISFASSGSFIGRDDRVHGQTDDLAPGTVINSFGVYTVTAPGLAAARGQVPALSEGGDTVYCHTGSWAVSGADLKVVVRCFNYDGTPYESGFRVMLSQ